MPTWASPVSDLRTLLSDGLQDKRAHQKKLVGYCDGINKIFKTVETRYVPLSVKVYKVTGSTITLLTIATDYTEDDPVAGDILMVTAPIANAVIKASYYWRHFIDSELNFFLINAAQKLGGFTDPTLIDPDLQPAAIHFAAADAYEKLAVRWMERLSEQYLVEDSPGVGDGKPMPKPEDFAKLADFMMKRALTLRDDFYKRQGRRFAPSVGIAIGNAREITPRR